jgi:hypothetical protein
LLAGSLACASQFESVMARRALVFSWADAFNAAGVAGVFLAMEGIVRIGVIGVIALAGCASTDEGMEGCGVVAFRAVSWAFTITVLADTGAVNAFAGDEFEVLIA